jgi:hypothetical protein
LEKGELNGEGVEGVTGEAKEAGRAGTEGGFVVEALGVLVDAETGTAATEAEDGAEEGEATATIEPLRSHGFGGEPIVHNKEREDSRSVNV